MTKIEFSTRSGAKSHEYGDIPDVIEDTVVRFLDSAGREHKDREAAVKASRAIRLQELIAEWRRLDAALTERLSQAISVKTLAVGGAQALMQSQYGNRTHALAQVTDVLTDDLHETFRDLVSATRVARAAAQGYEKTYFPERIEAARNARNLYAAGGLAVLQQGTLLGAGKQTLLDESASQIYAGVYQNAVAQALSPNELIAQDVQAERNWGSSAPTAEQAKAEVKAAADSYHAGSLSNRRS